MELQEFIKLLGSYKHQITRQQLKTIKGQAIAGDLDGAKKGLEKITRGKK